MNVVIPEISLKALISYSDTDCNAVIVVLIKHTFLLFNPKFATKYGGNIITRDLFLFS